MALAGSHPKPGWGPSEYESWWHGCGGLSKSGPRVPFFSTQPLTAASPVASGQQSGSVAARPTFLAAWVWSCKGEAGLWKQTMSISGSVCGEYCSTCSFFLELPPKLDSISRGWERPVTIATPLWEWEKSATEQAGLSSGSGHQEGKETEQIPGDPEPTMLPVVELSSHVGPQERHRAPPRWLCLGTHTCSLPGFH